MMYCIAMCNTTCLHIRFGVLNTLYLAEFTENKRMPPYIRIVTSVGILHMPGQTQ